MGFGDTPDFRQLGQADDLVVVALATRFPHESGRGKELGEVFVRGDHERLETGGFGAFHQGADDVVRLEAVDLEHRDSERAAEVFDVRDGGGEFLWHLVALRFVSRIAEVARRRRGGVEGDADVARLLFFEDEQQRIDEAVKCGRVDALRVANGILDEREMGAVNQGHAVEQEKAVHGRSLRGDFPRVQQSRA